MIRLAVDFKRRTAELDGGLLQGRLHFIKNLGRHDFAAVLGRENQMNAEFGDAVPPSVVVGKQDGHPIRKMVQ